VREGAASGAGKTRDKKHDKSKRERVLSEKSSGFCELEI
jgi:hypothetical protein